MNDSPKLCSVASLQVYKGWSGSVGFFVRLLTNFPSSLISFTFILDIASTVRNNFEGELPSIFWFLGLGISLYGCFFFTMSEMSNVFLKNFAGGSTSTYDTILLLQVKHKEVYSVAELDLSLDLI